MTDAAHDLVADAVEALLAGECPPRRVREIEAGGSPAELWRTLSESGFLDALVPEASGGAGLGLEGALPILFACGRHAVPVPLAHTAAVRAMLACAGARWPLGPATFATLATSEGDALTCRRVPFGRVAEWVLVGRPGDAVLLPTSAARVTALPARGSLEADLRWEAPPPDAVVIAGGPPLRTLGAALHAALLAGAMERALALTVAYANERVQFGKSIGKFQAIQQELAVMAEQVSASRMAARIGCAGPGHGCAGPGHLPGELQAAVAKARTSEAAVSVAAAAHAVHGAIGITEECDLNLYTRRLHAWRLADGAERYWNERIGEALLAEPGPRFAALVRDRLSPLEG